MRVSFRKSVLRQTFLFITIRYIVEGRLVRSLYLFRYLYVLRDSFPIIKKKNKKKKRKKKPWDEELRRIALQVIPGRKAPLCQGFLVSRSVVEKFQAGFPGYPFSSRKLSVITGRDRDFTFLRKYHCTNGNASVTLPRSNVDHCTRTGGNYRYGIRSPIHSRQQTSLYHKHAKLYNYFIGNGHRDCIRSSFRGKVRARNKKSR